MMSKDAVKLKTQVRLADIAGEVGVSLVTVAKVLHNTGGSNTRVSEKTAAKIHDCAKKMGYRPNMMARHLAGKSSNLIGVVLDSCAPEVYHIRLSEMEKYAAELGYRFIIGQAHEDTEKVKAFASDFISYGAEGIICMAHAYPGKSEEILQSYPLDKTVFQNKPIGGDSCCYVSCNLRRAFSQMVEYLAGRGRKRIGLLIIDRSSAEISMNIRLSGYLDGLQSVGLTCGQGWVQRLPLYRELTPAIILPVVRHMVEELKLDAIMAANDHLAIAVIRCLNQMGIKVPGQVAVSGSDNQAVTPWLTPALTTIDENNGSIARALVDLLLKLLKNPELSEEEKSIIINPVLIKRESA